jgi:hypothetical protein
VLGLGVGRAQESAGEQWVGVRFGDAIVRWVVADADQTERDHGRMLAAIRAGRIAAEMGV